MMNTDDCREPGQYAELLAEVQARTRAAGIILIVLNGIKGSAVSVQLPDTPTARPNAARLLRELADEIWPPRRFPA